MRFKEWWMENDFNPMIYGAMESAWNAAREAQRDDIAKMFDGEVWAYDYREIAAAIRNSGGN